MKNFYIQTIVLLFVVLAGFTSKSNAQFSGGETVYCYQYVKTIDDGVSSKMNDQDEIYFVNFQKDMMGFTTVRTSKEAGKKMVENRSYYNNEAINDLAENWKKWNSTPARDNYYGQPPYEKRCIINKYNHSYSTSQKYSYQQYRKYTNERQVGYTRNYLDIPVPAYAYSWTSPIWYNMVYSFSVDKSEMIVWSTTNPARRHYYKKIDPNSLKPNLDFLD